MSYGRDLGGAGLKSLTDVFIKTRLWVACYKVKCSNKLIKAAWKRELPKRNQFN